MLNERMSRKQRVSTVLKGGIPDRVPCIPLVYYFAASYAGVPYAAFIRSMRAYRSAMDRCYREVGPWDAMYPLPITMDAPDYEIVWGAGVGLKPSRPQGGDEWVQTFQFSESSTLLHERDYERMLAYSRHPRGYAYIKFLELLVARSSGRQASARFWATYLLPSIIRFGAKWLGDVVRWRLKGVPNLVGFSLEAPFDTISMARGIEPFCYDLFERGDELEEVVMKLSRSFAYIAWRVCQIVGIKNFLLLVHRTSNDFISPDHYRRFVHPSIKLMADELSRRGIIMGLHCDGNWDLNFEHMTDLPTNTYFQLDSYSDMVRAREVLGSRYTLMGDVPATMLVAGKPTDVDDYCLNLYKKVGRNGRFVLSSGCEVPPNARPENVRAMIQAAKRCRYD